MPSTILSNKATTTTTQAQQPSFTHHPPNRPEFNIPQPSFNPLSWQHNKNINNSTLPKEPIPAPVDGFADLQNQDQEARLAKSRADLLNESINLMITSFKNKRALDAELEREVKKLEKKGLGTHTHTQTELLKEYELVLAGSEGWVQMNLEELNIFLEEKDRCLRAAAMFEDVHMEKERKKEEKQVKEIQKYADKMIKMKERRDARGEEEG